jgi:hypothetical protein
MGAAMLDLLLKTHRDTDEIDFQALWARGLFAFDANVLLDLYRLPKTAARDLIGVLSSTQLRERIWIAFQVFVEYLNNRHDAISDQKRMFNKVREILGKAKSEYDVLAANLEVALRELKLKRRHSLIDSEKFVNAENISSGMQFVDNFLSELEKLEGSQSDVGDADKLKETILDIFLGKVGAGFSQQELTEIYKLGEKRYEASFPPGYKDKGKSGSYVVGASELQRKFGDLVLWKELLKKARDDEAEFVVLVTGDLKEDWWQETSGKKLGPRRELLNEIYTEAPSVKVFYMYDTASFLRYAKEFLNASVDAASISQAEDLVEESMRTLRNTDDDFTDIADVISMASVTYPELHVDVDSIVRELHPARIHPHAFFTAMVEIFENALVHGRDKVLRITARLGAEGVDLRFANTVHPLPDGQSAIAALANAAVRGRGLPGVEKALAPWNVTVTLIPTTSLFVVQVRLPMALFGFLSANSGQP